MEQDLNCLLKYLTTTTPPSDFQAETLIVAGNSLPELIQLGAHFAEAQQLKKVIFTGGIGHATHYLVDNSKKLIPDLYDASWENLSEAEIMSQIFQQTVSGLDIQIIKEEKSTNTGENALFTYQLFSSVELPQKAWLLQDPLLQKRSQVTFAKNWQLPAENVQPVALAPFELLQLNPTLHFSQKKYDRWWEQEYFLSLLIGEVRRLQDNSEGYGPQGADFIPHVDVPEEVIASYQRVKKLLQQDVRK